MTDASGWCTIESDPGVFTALLREIGVDNVQVEELYTLSPVELHSHGRVHGLVFLFRYDAALAHTRPSSGTPTSGPSSLFFARQTIPNACATQAILSIVMNAGIERGAELTRLLEFTAGMDAQTKGLALGNCEVIRTAHNSFAGAQQFVLEGGPAGEKEEPFHFVAYVAHEGVVYELDGLQAGPVLSLIHI